MSRLTKDQVHHYLEYRLGYSLPARDKVSVLCPFHNDRTKSATVFLDDRGGFNCHGCSAKGGLIEFEMRFSGCDREAARRNIGEITGASLDGSGRQLVGTYLYLDLDRLPVFRKERYESANHKEDKARGGKGDKTFVIWRYDAEGKWQKELAADTPRVPYNYPDLVASNFVFVCEGEEKSDLLSALAPRLWPDKPDVHIATTSNHDGAWEPGQKPRWQDRYSPSFAGKVAVICVDNDLKGRTWAKYIAASVHPYAKAVYFIAFPGQREHYDVGDWIRERSGDAGKLLADLRELVKSASLYLPAPAAEQAPQQAPQQAAGSARAGEDGWPEPEDLGGELPPVPPFDLEMLPSSLRARVNDVALRMQVPIDFPAVVAVITLAGLCGRRAFIQPKAKDYLWKVVPNLWGALVALPSMKKSPVIAEITRPAHAIEALLRAAYEQEVLSAKREECLAELKQKAWRDRYVAYEKDKGRPRKKGEAEPFEPLPPDTSVDKPVAKRVITTDPTSEALHLMMRDNPAGIFVLRDELSGWLAGLEKQGREQERAFYLECWSGYMPHTLDRIGRGSIHVPHCCATVFGSIQPARLRYYLDDVVRGGLNDDGLFPRFQLLIYPDGVGHWEYGDELPDSEAIKRAEAIYTRIASLDADYPLLLKFTPEAQELFIAWITELENRLLVDELLSPVMQVHLAKYRSLMPSLALLFSLADGITDAVGLAHAQQAAAWCVYLEAHARRAYASRISPERQAALTLSKKFRKGWPRDKETGRPAEKVSVRQIYQNDWTGLGTPEEVRAALRELEGASWVREETSENKTGRPSEVYLINPRTRDKNISVYPETEPSKPPKEEGEGE
jgi:putative DNA primase/helicase